MNLTPQHREYIARINRAMDHIQKNFHNQLQLKEIAAVANFSPFHFHRLFKGLVGETLTSYIQRLRVEMAASMLLNSPNASITAIAFDCGFSGSSAFARLFKDHFGMSASKWRDGGAVEYLLNRKNGKANSNNCKDYPAREGYINCKEEPRDLFTESTLSEFERRQVMPVPKSVEVKEISPMTVAYVRHIGPYKGDSSLFQSMFEKLSSWAGPRGLFKQPDLKVLSVYHDDPSVTDEKNLRVSMCITVPDTTEVGGEIGKMTIDGGKYAVAHFEITVDEYEKAWDYVFGEWMPKSGYQPGNGPCYELMLNNPEEHPEEKHVIKIHVPVKPLQ
ncbi:GyrI-like domain-containing protein [Chitinispirillales bacterium ANBcel5]|uniref:AraC family transcriptional regulator n=1 Tax=Cellulosispirillum alkaliphilum TaxID=3039283 RepID=UPI002A4F4F2B|nr:GyrI-like domain-containing protein [Chitinispirillales bacterium ANBcel5]